MNEIREKSKTSVILQRVIFSFVILAIVVPPFFLIQYVPTIGPIVGMVVFQLIAILGIYEITVALGFNKIHSLIAASLTTVASFLVPYNLFERLIFERNLTSLRDVLEVGLQMSWQIWVFPLAGTLIMLLDTRIWSDEKKKGKIAILVSIYYIIIIFCKGIWLSNLESIQFIFYLLPISIISDTFAYFGGMIFGKKWFKGAKFSPKISPKKTWAGFVIGTSMSMAYAIGFGIYCGYWSTFGSIQIYITILMGIVLPIVSAYGDLLFSAFKRYLGIKDFSKLIPGHGGVFDRLDALSIVVTTSMAIHMFALLAM